MPHWRTWDGDHFDFEGGTNTTFAENDKGLLVDFDIIGARGSTKDDPDTFTYTVQDGLGGTDGSGVPLFDSGFVVSNSVGGVNAEEDMFLI